jgi:Ca2+/Na+ antiporter
VNLLLVKLTLAPALVVGSSLAGRRWGHEVSGRIVALPLVAGPILLITTLQHGTRFGAHTAAASLLGLVALASFVVAFAHLAPRHGWLLALLGGWITFVLLALAFSTVSVAPAIALLVALAAYAAAPLLTPAPPSHDSPLSELPAWDLPARAVATAALVLALTGASAGLGTRLTGVLTPFPISTGVLAASVLALEGPIHASLLRRGFLRGAFGFVAFCFFIAVLLIPLGTAAAFAIALCAALLAQLISYIVIAIRSAPAQLEREPQTQTLISTGSSRRSP